MKVAISALNGFCLVVTFTFIVYAMVRLPRVATKLIIALICVINIMGTLQNFVLYLMNLVSVPFFHSIQFPLIIMKVILGPIHKSVHQLLTVYAIHRYALITGKATLFSRPAGLIIFSSFTIFLVYVSNWQKIFYVFAGHGDLNIYLNEYVWYGTVTLEFVMAVTFSSLHIYALRSVSRKLEGSARFLRTLTATDVIRTRLDAIARIKKFNISLFILQTAPPLLAIFRQNFTFYISSFCTDCDLAYFLLVDASIIEHVVACFKSSQLISFAVLHWMYLKSFSFSCCKNI